MKLPVLPVHSFEDATLDWEFLQTYLTIPYGTTSWSANVTTNNTHASPTFNTNTFVGGGMLQSASGLIVPRAGIYRCGCLARCDTTGGGQIQSQITFSSAPWTGSNTDLEIGPSTHSTKLSVFANLNAGCTVGLDLFTTVAGTWYGTGAWGNSFDVQFVSLP